MSEYRPKPYLTFVKNHPQVAEAYQKLGEACHNDGPLEEKSRHLIKLGIAVALRSQGGVKTHVRRSIDAGAVEGEIRHAIMLSLTTCGFPGMIAAMNWANEVLDARRAEK